jgi:hypothetical protein
MLNDRIDVAPCTDGQHDTARRQRTEFCSDCGLRLIAIA